MLKIGWFDCGHLDNQYYGSDGGSYIRIPLLRELTNRGHTVHFHRGPTQDYDVENEDVLGDLGIYTQSLRYRDSLECVVKAVPVRWLDVLIVEARSPDVDGYQKMLDAIEYGYEHDIDVFLFDRNNWAKELPDWATRDCTLLRPYTVENDEFDEQYFFRYWCSDVPTCNVEPMYDLVYVGNRYGREDQMDEFLDGLDDLDVLVAGNWTIRDQDVTGKYDWVDFIGPTPHYSTIPLLSLGKATFHVGKPDYNKIGMLTMRPFEAWMANRPCFISDDIENVDHIVDSKLHTSDSDEIREILNDPYKYQKAKRIKPTYLNTVEQAASHLEHIIYEST